MSLSGKTIKNSYVDLLQLDNSNSGIGTSVKQVKDGAGTSSSLLISDDQGNPAQGVNKPLDLGTKLRGLIPVINSTDFKPTDQSHSVFIEIKEEIDEVLEKLRYFQEVDLIDFQELVEKHNIPTLKTL